LGPVSLLLRHEATLRDIINSAIEYRRLLNEFLQLELRELGGGTILEWNLVPGLRSAQGIRLLATIAYRVLVEGAGVEWQPECIHFRDSPPARIGTFRRVFNCALEFDSPFDGMSFSSACLDLPNKYADGELMVQARRLLNLMPGIRREETILERARAAVPFLIADGKLRADDMARCLGMSVRTLQRRLIEEGRSFSSLLNEARRELAIRYLSNTNQPITEVAHSTGYSSLSSFTRWFISQFGVSPGQWRRTMRRRDAAPLSQRDVPDEP
jgi:AraC-like DNA-binding protein